MPVAIARVIVRDLDERVELFGDFGQPHIDVVHALLVKLIGSLQRLHPLL